MPGKPLVFRVAIRRCLVIDPQKNDSAKSSPDEHAGEDRAGFHAFQCRPMRKAGAICSSMSNFISSSSTSVNFTPELFVMRRRPARRR